MGRAWPRPTSPGRPPSISRAHPGASPAQVKSALLNNREQIALLNDPDGNNEGVLRVAGAPSVDNPPPPGDGASPPPEHHEKKKNKKKHKKKKKH